MNDTMWFDDNAPRLDSRDRLTRIAQAVGCQVADLFGAPAGRSTVGDTADLLACWTRIETREGRDHLLNVARRLSSAGIATRPNMTAPADAA